MQQFSHKVIDQLNFLDNELIHREVSSVEIFYSVETLRNENKIEVLTKVPRLKDVAIAYD